MKTTKQIADDLGVSKQQVYRYIKKNCINESLQKANVMYYDETAETLIKQGFLNESASKEVNQESHQITSNEAILIEMLQRELDIKNKQIEDLSNALVLAQETAKAAQLLHAGTIQKSLIESNEVLDEHEVEEKTGFWKKLFKK